MKNKISFKDAENNLFNIEVEIREKEGYKEFSASGDCGNSSGQCLDQIKPANEFQRRLKEMWEQWHLNGMHSGTEKQESTLKNWKERPKGFSYTEDCQYLDSLDSNGKPLSKIEFDKIQIKRQELEKEIAEVESQRKIYSEAWEENKKKIVSGGSWISLDGLMKKEFYGSLGEFKRFIDKNLKLLNIKLTGLNKELDDWKLKTLLYDLHPETNKVYQYGSGWLHRDLPENFEEELKEVCNKIVELEKQKKESLSGGKWEEDEDPKIIALAQKLNLYPNEAKEDISEQGNNCYNYSGVDYFVGDEEEVHEEALVYLKDDTYIYQSWVEEQCKNGNASKVKNIDDWAEWVIQVDGYGHILNSWDGSKDTEEVNGVEYYIIRR